MAAGDGEEGWHPAREISAPVVDLYPSNASSFVCRGVDCKICKFGHGFWAMNQKKKNISLQPHLRKPLELFFFQQKTNFIALNIVPQCKSC
jgi:hypothetical protein